MSEALQMPLRAIYTDAKKLALQQLTPAPVFLYCAQAVPNGVVGRYMFPLDGSFGMVTILVDSLKKEYVDEGYLEVRMLGKVGASYRFPVKPGENKLDYVSPVERGTRVEVLNIGDTPLEGIWISFMYKPGIIK